MSLDIYFIQEEGDVYSRNITHNLGKMADEAGLYKPLWQPEEIGINKAGELVELLTKGLLDLWARPDHYEQFDASNGWGRYDHFVEFVQDVLKHALRYPDAEIKVSR